ncbi:MAG: hypothetical protein M3Q57_02145 [Pseudomonadota bacterium]|nr:hypothetical protein [Pseudomonadota bacterium]
MIRPMARGAVATVAAALLSGASGPRALAPASPGLWEVGTSARGADARPICVSDPAALARWEHRRARCTSVVLSDVGNKAVVDYACAGSGFGRSEMTLVTPRTLRIATQGISPGGPFNYILHARRVGNCTAR